jgi:hypothetical protein
MPSAVLLDLARAEDVLGNANDAGDLARYMSLNGTSLANSPVVKEPAPPGVRFNGRGSSRQLERRDRSGVCELVCLLCSRPAQSGQQRCGWCDGSLVVEEALTR